MNTGTSFIWKDYPRTLRIVGYRGGRFFPPIPVTEPDHERDALLRLARAAKRIDEWWTCPFEDAPPFEFSPTVDEFRDAIKDVEHLIADAQEEKD